MSEPAFPGALHVVGVGLLGSSVALAAAARGVQVWLSDTNAEHVRTASGLGAGRPAPDEGAAALTVVAVPPDHIAEVVAAALEGGGAVTDVGSVKDLPLQQVRALAGESASARYVGSHPMAGSERSGPLAASSALFEGRPWAITPHPHADPGAVRVVESLVRLCGAEPVRLTPVEHDQAVARTSHLPHLLAVLTAGQLAEAVPDHLTLSGQGVRDVTRVAAGDPALWSQILRANAGVLDAVLHGVRDDLDDVIAALRAEDADPLRQLLDRGVAGTRAIPAKHGGPPLEVEPVYVAVPDHPGELARLFADVGASGVNVEDVRMDHDPARPVGLAELSVAAGSAGRLRGALEERGWTAYL